MGITDVWLLKTHADQLFPLCEEDSETLALLRSFCSYSGR